MLIKRTAHTCIAILAAFGVAASAYAGDSKPACCAPTEEVKHDDDHKHDDHAGHDHGGGLFDVVKKAGDLNTFAAALGQAELEETLSHDQWTLFAPTDEAFAKLPPETLDLLLKPENKNKLKAVLLAHVTKGAVPGNTIKADPTKVKSEAGSELTIVRDAAGNLTVNGANVVKADTPASNGIIHTIDTVIIPPGVID